MNMDLMLARRRRNVIFIKTIRSKLGVGYVGTVSGNNWAYCDGLEYQRFHRCGSPFS